MAKNAPAKIEKVGPLSIQTNGDESLVSVDLAQVAPPTHIYVANWLLLKVKPVATTLCFGQAVCGELASRLDVRIPSKALYQLFQAGPQFIDQLSANPSQEAEPWEDAIDAMPIGGKYLIEDATFVLMAYGEDQGEASFYQLPPSGIMRYVKGARDHDLLPRVLPRVTVSLTVPQLKSLVLQIAKGLQAAGVGV